MNLRYLRIHFLTEKVLFTNQQDYLYSFLMFLIPPNFQLSNPLNPGNPEMRNPDCNASKTCKTRGQMVG